MSTRKSAAARSSVQNDGKTATPASGKAQRADKPVAGPNPAGSRVVRTAQVIGQQVADNPLAALVGAAAVTAGIALLLPASRREAEVMGELADKIGEVARDAADSAAQAGREQAVGLAQAALGSVGGTVVGSLIGASAQPADSAADG